jgi:CubicO group peptidase (beta-lactamase class C family)/uncharacterized pyridoxamine 5'-phosphate oxidase family protein
LAVIVAKDGEILYRKAFGFANLEDSVPATVDTKFRIGSITKQFTAAAILKLQEEGLLSVDDKLSKFIPDYPRGDEVTVYHLLGHTSGIHSHTSKPEFFKTLDEEVSPEEMVEFFKNDEYDFNPGEKWLYNNSGYFLLGYIVEKVSGKTLGDYLRDEFFEPLGMNNTGIHSWKLNLENEAIGYSYEGNKAQIAKKWDMSQAGGAGALYSTLDDLYRWNEAIFNEKALNAESIKAAFTPIKLNNGSDANAMGAKYGFGWMFTELRGLKEIAHSGGFDGFNAYLTLFPEENFTVVALTNCLPPPNPARGTIGIMGSNAAHAASYFYLWEKMDKEKGMVAESDIDPEIYNDYVGRYDYGTYGGVLEVTREDDRLFAQMSTQPKIEIFPSSKDHFFWKVVDAQIDFMRDKAGVVTHAIHHQGGMEIKAPKMKDEKAAEVDPASLDAYVGKYDFGRAVLTVTKENGALFAQMAGQPKFQIFPRSENEFFWKVVNAQITFLKDDSGEVNKALYRQGDVKIEVKKIE